LDVNEADLYRQTITAPGADGCGCIYCKNFAAQRQNVFPAEFLRLLGELGVDPMKEWEAFEYNFDAKNPHKLVLYGGWFLFAGALVARAEKKPNPQTEASLIGSHHRSRQARCRLLSSYVLSR